MKESLSMWWTHPVLPRSWGLLGKVLQYFAGLTILLDLLGEAKVEAFYRLAGESRKRTTARIKMIVPKSASGLMKWFVRFWWLIIPLALATTGYAFFWALVNFLHFSTALSVWLAVSGMVAAPLAGAFELLAQYSRSRYDWRPVRNFGATLVIAAGIGSLIGHSDFAGWKMYLFAIGIYILMGLGLVAAAVGYLVCISAAFILFSIMQLAFLTVLLAVVRITRIALRGKAHPLRWLAFLVFTLGFCLDLLAS